MTLLTIPSPETQSHQAVIKRRNLSAILLALLQHDIIARTHLADLTNLSPTTIGKIITELLDAGIVIEDQSEPAPGQHGLGRPRMALRLVPDARFALGCYFRVGEFEIGITDLRARLLHHATFQYHITASPAEIIATMARHMLAELDQQRIPLEQVVGVGVGLNGSVDPVNGVHLFAPGLGWRDVPVRDWLAAHLSLPVCVDNNIRVMALSEMLFNGFGSIQHMALVSVHYGLGVGLIVDGNLLHGAHAAAGEIGHMYFPANLYDPEAPPGVVPLESLISRTALVKDGAAVARRAGDEALADDLSAQAPDSLDRLFDAARTGHPALCRLLEARAYCMGIALASLVNLVNPELVLLAGSVYVQGRDVLLPPTERALHAHLFGHLSERVRLDVVDPARRIGVIGAASFGLDTYFYRSGVG